MTRSSQSPGHSAHIGQGAQVHYRWHPLYGHRVRRIGGEQRLAGRFVHIGTTPGVVTVVAAWMLNPVACAGMEIGVPRTAVLALLELHHPLIEAGSGEAPGRIRTSSRRSMIRKLPTSHRTSTGWRSIA